MAVKRLRRFDPRRWFGTALVVVATLGIATFDVGSATPTAQTVNVGNVIVAAAAPTVLPPTDVAAALILVVPPVQVPLEPSYCTANITWTASVSTGVTGYEIRRVLVGTDAQVGASWTVVGAPPPTSTTDSPVPLVILANSYGWQVRALFDSWYSDWATATVDDALLCLL